MKASYKAKPNLIGNDSLIHCYFFGNVMDLSLGTELKSIRAADFVVFQLRYVMQIGVLDESYPQILPNDLVL